MSIGLLLVLNLLTIPFIFEVEQKISKSERLTIVEIFRLSNFFCARWRYGYFVLIFLFSALAMAPTRSGRIHTASSSLLWLVAVIQMVLWGLLLAKYIYKNKGK